MLTRPVHSLIFAMLYCGLLAFSVSAATTRHVTSNADTGANTLRTQILSSVSGDTVDFVGLTTPATITLTSGQISITSINLTLIGPGANLLTISGNHTTGTTGSRVFYVNSSALTASGITFANGYCDMNTLPAASGGYGGAVEVDNTASVATQALVTSFTDCAFVNNNSIEGGALDNACGLALLRCTFSGNTAAGTTGGGGAMSYGTFTTTPNTIVNCTFANNTSNGPNIYHGGGAITNYGDYINGAVTNTQITNSTFVGNIDASNIATVIEAFTGPNTGVNNVAFKNCVFANNKNGSGVVGNYFHDDQTFGHATITSAGGNVCDVGVSNNGYVGAQKIITTFQGSDRFSTAAILASLGALASNGGPIQTIALNAGSPAIAAGATAGAPTTDARGITRASPPDSVAYQFIPPPTVTSIAPTSGPTAGSTSVTITGTNLSGATAVTIGSAAATSLSANTATSITCITPAGSAGTASVVVTTAGGTNAANSLYTYLAPILSSATPNSGQVGQSNLNVALLGLNTHFVQATSTATFGTGITVNSLTVTDATHATANVSISSGATVGSSNVTVSTGGEVVTLTNGFSITVGAASSMTANAGTTPQSTTINTAFTNALAVTVKDSGSNPVSGVSVTFTAPGTGASGIFSNSTATIVALTNASGVASATFTANTTASGPYTVTAAATGLTTVNFALTNTPGAPSKLAFGQQPSNAVAGVDIAPVITVQVLDAFGNLTNSSLFINLAIGTNPSSGTLSGSATVAAVAGVATFSTLNIDKVGTGYTLSASSTGLTGATSSAFNITNGPAASIVATTGASQQSTVTTAFPTIFTATVTDAAGNPIPSVNVTFTAPVIGASGTFVNTTTTTSALTNASGVATAATFTANSTAGGPYNVTAAVGGVGTSANFALTNNAAIAFTTTTLSNWTIKQTGYSQTVVTTGGTGMLTFTTVIANLPTNMSFSSAGVLSGTPTAAGSFAFLVTATDTVGATGTQSYTVVINPAISITTTSLPNWTINQIGYSQTVSATGGTGTLTFSTITANLPTGMSFSSAGVLSGTPSAAASFTFVVTATDTAGATATQSYTVTINPIPTLTPLSLPNSTVGVAYSKIITVTAGTSTGSSTMAVSNLVMTATGITVVGKVPAMTGFITVRGTPIVAGTVAFDAQATDSVGAKSATKHYSFTINPIPALTPLSLPDSTVNIAYNQTIFVSAGSGTGGSTFALNNLSNTATGINVSLSCAGAQITVNGTPTSAGAVAFDVLATDSVGGTSVSQHYAFKINPAIVIAPATLPGGVVYTAYTQTVTTTGGTGSVGFSISAGTLPPSVLLDPATGTLNGTPPASGTFIFSIKATDTVGATATQAYTVIIAPPKLTAAPATIPAGQVGVAYSAQLSGSGGIAPYSFALSSGIIPPGLTLSASGLLSGTPTEDGVSKKFTLKLTDASTGTGPYSSTQDYTLTVATPVLALAPATLPGGQVGTPYSQTFSTTGGTAPYTFAVTAGSLPDGLTLSAGGTLGGTPTTGASYSFTVTGTDSSTGSGPFKTSINYTVKIDSGVLFVSDPTATPNPQNGLEFTLDSHISTSKSIVVTWDFGDGSPVQTGAVLVHDFPAPGVYKVTVTATDGFRTATESLIVEIGKGGDTPILFELTSGKLKFDFTGRRDAMVLSGFIPLPQNFMPGGKAFIMSIGGYSRSFTLDSKGTGVNGNSKLTLAGSLKKGVFGTISARITLIVKNEDLFDPLKQYGFTNATVSPAQRIKVTVTVAFNGEVLAATPTFLYTATGGKSGNGKLTGKENK